MFYGLFPKRCKFCKSSPRMINYLWQKVITLKCWMVGVINGVLIKSSSTKNLLQRRELLYYMFTSVFSFFNWREILFWIQSVMKLLPHVYGTYKHVYGTYKHVYGTYKHVYGTYKHVYGT